MPIYFLILQTLFLWALAVILYRLKEKFTLIPLYSYLAVATILTHNLTDLDFSITFHNIFFLIGSVSFFTTLMFVTLLLYLFEGPRAGRLALWTIIGTSFFYILIVFLLGFQTNTSAWVQINMHSGKVYLWSLLSIVFDILFLAIMWELLAKIKKMFLVFRVFLITFGVLVLDTLIFVTGVFFSTNIFSSVLQGNLLTRLVLALVGTPVMTWLLKTSGFSEDERDKPQNFWEILNFRSDLEIKISNLEEMVKENKILQDELKASKETYELIISGSGAGILDWDVVADKIVWTPKALEMLGYTTVEVARNVKALKMIIHPEDVGPTFEMLDKSFATNKPFNIELRLKRKTGDYRWFAASGVTKYSKNKKPLRMVGTIIDIGNKKETEAIMAEKMEEWKK